MSLVMITETMPATGMFTSALTDIRNIVHTAADVTKREAHVLNEIRTDNPQTNMSTSQQPIYTPNFGGPVARSSATDSIWAACRVPEVGRSHDLGE
jgi:hypothetical protein